MKVAVIGSRTFRDKKHLYRILDECVRPGDVIVSGGAKGADSLARQWAEENGYKIIEFIPDWSTGLGAGFKRNRDIVEECDYCIAFWDGESRGTEHSLNICKEIRKPYRIELFKNHAKKEPNIEDLFE